MICIRLWFIHRRPKNKKKKLRVLEHKPTSIPSSWYSILSVLLFILFVVSFFLLFFSLCLFWGDSFWMKNDINFIYSLRHLNSIPLVPPKFLFFFYSCFVFCVVYCFLPLLTRFPARFVFFFFFFLYLPIYRDLKYKILLLLFNWVFCSYHTRTICTHSTRYPEPSYIQSTSYNKKR